MFAYINGIKVEGTPEEIRKLMSIEKTNENKTSLCGCVDWRDMQPSPFCKKCKGKG